MTSDLTPDAAVARLQAENDDLRTRVELAEAALDALRDEAISRRAEVRAYAELLPAAMSRRTHLAAMFRDVRNHPDKSAVLGRALAKLGRAPRKLARRLHVAS